MKLPQKLTAQHAAESALLGFDSAMASDAIEILSRILANGKEFPTSAGCTAPESAPGTSQTSTHVNGAPGE